jgi:hypothetical protein
MADSHLQVNHDGSLEIRKTVLWGTSEADRKEVLLQIFSQPNWRVDRLDHIDGSFWKVETSSHDISYKINLYVSSVRDEARQPDEYKMQLGAIDPIDEDGWITLIMGVYTISHGAVPNEYILSAYNKDRFTFRTNPSIRGTRTIGLQKAKILGLYKTDISYLFRPEFIYFYLQNQELLNGDTGDNVENTENIEDHNEANIQTIFYGCPGTGKSHRVEQILKSASKGVVKVAETTENRSLNFHQYLKEQPYFSTGDAYHIALKSRGKKSLYNVILERGLADGINSCFDITDIETLKKIQRSINENNPFPPRHQEAVYAIEYYIKFLEEKPSVQLDTEFRTTFHPDSDYASFVGCYKPTMIEGEDNENRISYEFVPQVFTNAYVRAWELYNSGSKENVYLVIEEINRGNCAQIFGDLFQLLDRYEDGEKAGFSKYEVDPDADLSQYLIGLFDKQHCAKKLCLPPNLIILATMNTSDQSLFPMDSAFKRRWSWKYVPIDYEHKDSSKYTITIGDRTYSWNKFLQDVNERIKAITQSEDKQIGNFFIAHAVIKQDEFINKVMFYLWSEICKDNYKTRDNFFRNRNNKDEEFSFNDLFGKDATALLQGFMAYIAGEDAKVVEEQEESHEVEG